MRGRATYTQPTLQYTRTKRRPMITLWYPRRRNLPFWIVGSFIFPSAAIMFDVLRGMRTRHPDRASTYPSDNMESMPAGSRRLWASCSITEGRWDVHDKSVPSLASIIRQGIQFPCSPESPIMSHVISRFWDICFLFLFIISHNRGINEFKQEKDMGVINKHLGKRRRIFPDCCQRLRLAYYSLLAPFSFLGTNPGSHAIGSPVRIFVMCSLRYSTECKSPTSKKRTGIFHVRRVL